MLPFKGVINLSTKFDIIPLFRCHFRLNPMIAIKFKADSICIQGPAGDVLTKNKVKCIVTTMLPLSSMQKYDYNCNREKVTIDNICKMIEFLIDNIFVQFGGRLFCQVNGIPMGTNCAPLLADLFLYSYENEFLDNMIRSGHRRLARSFNLCYRYIDDLIVFNNKKFLDYLKEIYPSQLTLEKANKSDHLADYLDLTFIIDSGGKLSTRLYDKRDDFDSHIVNFPYLSSNIPSGPSYGMYVSQLIRYA